MRTAGRIVLLLVAALVLVVNGAATARAANFNIDWLTMAPTAIGSPIPNNSVFVVAGIGNVTVSYAIPAHWSHSREMPAPFVSGNVVAGPDTYLWSDYEYFGTIFTAGDLGPEVGTITYTFPAQLSAGTVYVGALGLGATTSFGGGTSTTRVLQNGTFLGDWVGDATAGATQFIGGSGNFTLMNSTTGAGGVNPHWNTHLGVVRIDDPVSSITVIQTQLRGDGIGVNVGFVPDGATPANATTWGRLKELYR